MYAPTSKKVLLTVLVASFVVQTGLVYSDDVDIELSADAVAGRQVFHEYSCQVCHQLWGQGGFLGPDLTNAASRIDDSRLHSLLTVGSGQMPALHLDDTQIAHVRAFLEEIDRPDIGRGQLRLGDPEQGAGPQAAFDVAMAAAEAPGDVAAGFATFRAGICSTCHEPFRTSLVGAPDLSTVVERVDEAGLHEVLTDGRPLLGMPPPVPALSEAERREVIEYFRWLNENRTRLRDETSRIQGQRTVDWSGLDWWEFR